MTPHLRKRSIRRRIRFLRRRGKAPRTGGDRLARLFLRRFRPHRGDRVAGYWPMRGEADIRPLLLALSRRGIIVLLPVVEAPAAPLLFRRWHPGMILRRGLLGSAEPPPSSEQETPDWLLVPLVAFDRAGGRLGQGGGFYDRTLSRLRRRAHVTAMGIAHAAQEVDRVPMIRNDQRLDWIITETEVIACGRGGRR